MKIMELPVSEWITWEIKILNWLNSISCPLGSMAWVMLYKDSPNFTKIIGKPNPKFFTPSVPTKRPFSMLFRSF